MHKRINVSLPEATLRLIERAATRTNRSRFIDAAIRHYVRSVGGERLRRRVEEGARRNAERDLSVAAEWFSIEDPERGES